MFFGHVANDVNILEFSQEEFISEGDKVAVTGKLVLQFKANGRVYDSAYAHILTVKSGKILRFRDFQDSAKAAHVCAVMETPER